MSSVTVTEFSDEESVVISLDSGARVPGNPRTKGTIRLCVHLFSFQPNISFMACFVKVDMQEYE